MIIVWLYSNIEITAFSEQIQQSVYLYGDLVALTSL